MPILGESDTEKDTESTCKDTEDETETDNESGNTVQSKKNMVVIILKFEIIDFSVDNCLQKMQQYDLSMHCLPRPISENMVLLSLVVRKPVLGVSDQVQHKQGCTATEDSQRLEISELGSRGIVLSI